MTGEFKPYSLEKARKEAGKMQEKIRSGEAKTYSEAEKLVDGIKYPEKKKPEYKEKISDIELSEYKFPNNFELKEKETLLRTNAGEFHMPLEMLKLYIKKFSLTPENFPDSIADYINTGKYDENPETIETRRKTKEFLISKGLHPEDYLEYDRWPNKKTPELLDVLPKEILNKVMFHEFVNHFTSQSANERHTYFEHQLLRSTSGQFFGRPFIGEFKADLEWQQLTRAEREKELQESNFRPQTLALFMSPEKHDIYGAPYKNYTHIEAESKKIIDQARQKLKLLYESIDRVPVPFEEIDYIKIVLKPIPYDKDMEAIPEPVSLEFLHNEEVVKAINNPSILKILKPRKEDCRLADTLEDLSGKKRFIEMNTDGFVHTLKFAEKEIPDWYSNYLNRISESELALP